MKTNRETSAVPKPSHLADTKIPHHPSNTSLLAEMDLSMSVDESFEASVTTQEVSIFDIEPPREDSESPKAREGSGSVSPHDTDWSEHGPRKRKRTDNRVGKSKPCDICGKLLSANHIRRHERNVHGMHNTNTNPPPHCVINSFETSQLLCKEPRVNLENIRVDSLRITPDDPCKGRRKISLCKNGPNTYKILGNSSSKKKMKKKKRNPQICPFCGIMTADRYDLIRHCSRMHLKEHLMAFINTNSLKCTFCGLERSSIGGLLFHLGAKHKREEMERLIDIEAGLCTHHQHEEENQNKCSLSEKSIPSNTINDRLANGDENENDKNSNLIKDEISPSPTENIISVETVELPEPLPSTLNPDDDCQINFDLKIERIESVPSDNNSCQIQDNNKIKEDSPDYKVDLRRVLDSDSDTESDNE